jgi:fructose-1,6-bisphosphatase/inositol monophosphatase family enzyme
MAAEELELLKDAILSAQAIIGEGQERSKGTALGVYDVVTDSDTAVERRIIESIRERYPDDRIISEETNPDGTIGDRTWIIDPIDGTVNFSRGMPFYGIQAVFLKDGSPEASVISFPALGELFWASEDGAFLNGERIGTAAPRPLKECILSTGDFSRRSETFRSAQARLMSECRDEVARFKMFGAACMDFAYLACGRTDVHVRFTNKLWDFLPGLYLAEKAGAVYDKNLMESSHILILCSSEEVLDEARGRILPHIR